MSRIVTAQIEPITAKKLMAGLRSNTARKLREHEPGASPPDFDHPLVKALVERMPHLPYRDLEAVKAHLETHDARAMTNARVVDGMLRLVNEELQKRDHERQSADVSFVDWLVSKGIAR